MSRGLSTSVAIVAGALLGYGAFNVGGGRYSFWDTKSFPRARFDHLTGTLRYWGTVTLPTFRLVATDSGKYWRRVHANDEILVDAKSGSPVQAALDEPECRFAPVVRGKHQFAQQVDPISRRLQLVSTVDDTIILREWENTYTWARAAPFLAKHATPEGTIREYDQTPGIVECTLGP